jgi:hypothetical protein
MPRVMRLLFIWALALAMALAGSPAPAQIRIQPIPPQVKPQWTPVPGAPRVYYAPNIPTDVFRYRGKYYFFWEGYIYKGNRPTGPWQDVRKVPAWFQEIDPAYFKTARKEGTPPPPAPAPGPPAAPPETAAPASPGQAPVTPAPPPAPPEATPEKLPQVM